MTEDLFSRYYPSLGPEEAADCDRIESEVASLLYKPTSDTSAHICGLVVDPSYRKQGHGSRLLAVLQSEYRTITANVLFSELNRLPFWQHLGFVVVESNLAEGFVGLRWTQPAPVRVSNP